MDVKTIGDKVILPPKKKERAFKVKTGRSWRTVGKVLYIRGEWSFYREVKRSEHALRTFDAWSLQANLLPILKADGVKWFYQYDMETGQMARISLKDFEEKSVERDFGEGKQLYVSIKYFAPVPGMGRVRKWINDVELVD